MSHRLVKSMDLAVIDPNVKMLESVLESSTEFALIGEDVEGNTRLWNEGARQLFGLTAEQALGKPTGPILHGPEVGALGRHLEIRESTLAAGRWNGIIASHGALAGERALSVTVMPWRSASKSLLGWLIVATQVDRESHCNRGTADTGGEDEEQTSHLARQVGRLSQRLESLKRLEQASVASHHPRRLAAAWLEHLQRLIPCWRIVVWIFDFATRTTEIVAADGGPETPRPTGSIVPLELFGLSDIAELYAERDVNVTNVEAAASLAPVISELVPLGLQSVVRIRLSADTRLLGALEMQFNRPNAVQAEQLEVAHEVAERLAVAIRHSILFQEVRSSRERLRMLSRQLLKRQEEEGRHLARELRDEIGESLSAARINLQRAIGNFEREEGVGLLKECDAIVHHVLQQVRDLSMDLRPSVLDDLGLVASIRWYLDRMSWRGGLKGKFSADPPEIRAVADIETACFRIAQEAVTNIVRRAQAREVEIHLNRIGARLELTIRDDGVGFDVAAARKRALRGESLGIIGMQERVELLGGRISIESALGLGTKIRARIPLETPARVADQGPGWGEV